MRILTLFLFLSVAAISTAQTPIVFDAASNGQTISTCNGFIIDSGGQGGPGYSNGETFIVTICPDTPGEIINIVFNTFNLSLTDDNPSPAVTNVDYMDVFDGNSIAAPTLGTYTGTELQMVIIQATALNPTGCITLRFRSNSVGTGAFAASVTCETPCATPTAAGIIVGGETSDSTRVCIGEAVNFADNGSAAAAGFTLADYEWDFMDGSTANGQNVSHSFDQPGQYLVQLYVTDDNGCGNTNLIDLQVFVGTNPTFAGFPGDTTLCMGESIVLTAVPEFYENTWSGFPGSQWIEDGCLPDTLLGVSQDIEILQTGFTAGATITDLSDIQSICIDLEHSFMGDLVILVQCPNGQTEILHQQGGGGTQIGEPNQLDNVDCSDPTTQGVPYNYCFTPTATETWVEWVDNNGFGMTLPAGSYEPVESMNNLLGCPLNGIWTLTVIDNWAADDGTLFGFSLNLDPSLYPPVVTFEPQIGAGADSSYWVTPANFMTSLSPDGDVLSLSPTASGVFSYNYYVVDNFGCDHDSTVTITVNDNPIPNAGPDLIICDGSPEQLNGSIAGGSMGSPCPYTFNLDDSFGDGWNGANLIVTIDGVSTSYTINNGSSATYTVNIPHGASLVVTFDGGGSFPYECEYEVVGPDGTVLIHDGGAFTAPSTTPHPFTVDCYGGYVFEWTSPVGTFSNSTIPNPVGTFNNSGIVTLTVYPTGHPLCATQDELNVSLGGTPMVITSISPDVTICPGESTALTATGSGGQPPYVFTWMQGATVLGTGVPFTVTPTATTTYLVVLTGECSTGPDTAYVTVTHPDPITPLLVPDDPDGCFPHEVSFTNMSTGGNVTSLFIDFGDGTTQTVNANSDISHDYPVPGSYTVSTTVTSDIGCEYSAAFPGMITVFGNPNANFTIQPNPVSMFDPTVQLIDNSGMNIATYSWVLEDGTPGAATTENVTATFPEGVASDYDVTLYITDENGCEDSVTHTVQVINEVILYAPNAFTPDGDEHNNTWFVHIEGIDMTQFQLRIYNRWGENIWESSDPKGEWDGTFNGYLVPEGTYNWVIEAKDVLTDERYEFTGSVRILY